MAKTYFFIIFFKYCFFHYFCKKFYVKWGEGFYENTVS
jgi:hypothetical protein